MLKRFVEVRTVDELVPRGPPRGFEVGEGGFAQLGRAPSAYVRMLGMVSFEYRVIPLDGILGAGLGDHLGFNV
jgi:hypothetical protein